LKFQLIQTKEVVNREKYQRLVGKLIFLAHALLNIAFVVSMVIQLMHSPGMECFDVINRILRYLKGTLRRGLLFKNMKIYNLKSTSIHNKLEV
jgi:hypothetical protein